MRWDSSFGQYDMGFRNYAPGLNQFLSRDMYDGALADMSLATDPFTGNRDTFGVGNPITNIELDGHMFPGSGGGGGSTTQSTSCPRGELSCGPSIFPGSAGSSGQQSQTRKAASQPQSPPPVIDAQTGLCVANCLPVQKAVDAYFRLNGCEGFSVSNFLGLVGLSPCGKSRDDVQRMLFNAVAQQQLQHDSRNSTFLAFLPSDVPSNEEIAMRIAQHIGTDTAAHGFGKLSTDEVAVQVEDLLNRVSAGDENLLMKTIRAGQPSEARVIFDPNTGLRDSQSDRSRLRNGRVSDPGAVLEVRVIGDDRDVRARRRLDGGTIREGA
jgi:hypothetical protein